MTFEKWRAEKLDHGYGNTEILIREAWQYSAEEEREACAQVCELIANDSDPDDFAFDAVNSAADAIRMRSNR